MVRANRFIYQHELLILIESCTPQEERERMCIMVMAFTGLRVSEAVRIKVTDFSPDFNSLSVLNTKVARNGSPGRIDIVYIPNVLRKMLQAYIQSNFQTMRAAYLFPSCGHGSQQLYMSKKWFHVWFSKKRRSLGGGFTEVSQLILLKGGRIQKIYRVGTHSFRRFYITQVYKKSGYDIKLTKELARHVKIETTDRYINFLQILERAPEVVNQIGELLVARPSIHKDQRRLKDY